MLIRFQDVCEKLCLSRNGLHYLISKEPSFPRPIRFSNAKQANIYFNLQEVNDWLECRKSLGGIENDQ